jgi:hypothetical protein
LTTDDREDSAALERGIEEELGGGVNLVNKISGPRFIEKRYHHNPSLWNREFVTLYESRVQERRLPQIVSKKVASVEWRRVEDIKKILVRNPSALTQTFAMWLQEVM